MSQSNPDRAQIQAALQQAQLAFNQGNIDVAEPIYAQCMQVIPAESEEYALCLHNMGEISEMRGNIPNAIWCQTRLMGHNIMQHMSMAPQLLSRMGHVATLYEKSGQNQDAQTLYQQMRDLKAQSAGMDNNAPPPPATSELTGFLLSLLDTAHRKFAQDPMQISATQRALESPRPSTPAPQAAAAVAPALPQGADQALGQRISGSQPQHDKKMSSTKIEMPAQSPPQPKAEVPPVEVPKVETPKVEAFKTEPAKSEAPAQPKAGHIAAPQFDLSGYTAHQQETGRFFPKQMEQLQQISAATPQAQPVTPASASSAPAEPAKPRSEKQNWESGWNNPPVDEVPELFEKEEEPPPPPKVEVPTEEPPAKKKRELTPKEDQKAKKKEQDKAKKVVRHLESKGPKMVAPINFSGPGPRTPAVTSTKNVSVGPPQFLPPTSWKAPKAIKSKAFKRDSLTTESDFMPKSAPKKESKPDWTQQITSAVAPKKGGPAKGGAPSAAPDTRGGGGGDRGGGGGRGRLGFDMGGGLDGPPADADAEFQNMMSNVSKLMNNKVAPIVVGLFFVVVTIVVVALPYKYKPEDVFKTMPRTFNTVDDERAITFNTLGDAEMRSGKTQSHIGFKYFLTDWRESVGLAFAPASEKQYWINDAHDTIDKQDVHAYLKDEMGNIYYPLSAPELKTTRSMDEIARKLGEWYLKHFLKYPKDASEFTGGELTYENAVTHEKETADWQAPIIIGSRESAPEANNKRADFYAGLAKGKGWENERKLAPGSINCCAVTFIAPGGNYQGLILQGGDHKGDPIRGSNNGDCYYAAWEDNKQKRDKPEPLPFLADSTMRKKMIVIFEQPVTSGFTFMVKSAACWLFAGLAFFGACMYLALPKKSRYKIAAIGWIAFNILMSTLYMVAPRL